MSPARDPQSTPDATRRAEDVRRILGRLGRLRARIRGIFATIGASRWVVGAITVLALYFLADWLLDLPLAVRRFVRLGLLQPPESMSLLVLLPVLALAAFLAVALTRRRHGGAALLSFVVAGIVGLLVWWAVRLLRPLEAQLPDQELALAVESRFGHLKDRLAAALDFQKQLEHPTRGESAAMMAAVVHEAAEEVRGLQFSRAVSGRRALRWAGGAVLAALAAVLVTVALPAEVGLWARRSLLLENVSWPRETTMVAVDLQPDGSYRPHDPATPYEVPIGRALTVYARAEGDTPGDALVLDLVPGQAALARRMFGVPGHPDVFAYEFLDVRRPFAFLVQGGDDEDEEPRYTVEITIPPRVLGMRSTITYPDYLGLEPEVVEDGTVSVPQGSKVDVTFTTDLEIVRAAALLGEVTVPAVPATEGVRTQFRFSYLAETSVTGRVLLRTADGKENDPSSDSFEIRVKTDQPPRLDWVWPRSGLEVTPTGRVALLSQASDDHGVSGLALEVRINADAPVRYELSAYEEGADSEGGVPQAVTDGRYGRRQVLAYVPVELAALKSAAGLPVAAQDAVSFRLTALDSRGQARESEWVRVDVGGASALERGLATQRSNVRLALEALRREQAARREDIQAVLADPVLGSAELDLVKSVRFAQGKIAQDADRAVQDLLGVFNAFVYDRLGAENPTTKILGFFDRHHRATYGLAAGSSEEPPLRPVEARGDWLGDPVFPYTLYDAIVGAWRGKVIFDTGLIDKMCGAIADSVEVGARLAPRAHRAAAEAVGGDKEKIRALLVAQDRNLEALDRLLESMRGWQSLHEMKLWLAGIVAEQEVLLHQLEGEDPDKKAEKK